MGRDIGEFGFQIATFPLQVTGYSEHKWVRVCGILMLFPWLPFAIMGMGLAFVGMIVDIFESA